MTLRTELLKMYAHLRIWFKNHRIEHIRTVLEHPNIHYEIKVQSGEDEYHTYRHTEKVGAEVKIMQSYTRDFVLNLYSSLKADIEDRTIIDAFIHDIDASRSPPKAQVKVIIYEYMALKDVIEFMAKYPCCVFEIEWAI